MNAAVRAIIRGGAHFDFEVIAVRHGYEGLINGDFIDIEHTDVSGIIQRGGTVLKSARSEKFRTEEGRKKAANQLKDNGIEGLIVIGGDGTFRGAHLLSEEQDIAAIGVPATIDNDLFGSDETIGYDTALNTAVEAIDKIRDTADAHERLFFVEVMGRDAGFIALETGIASGAEIIVLPEYLTSIDEIRQSLQKILKVHKRSTLAVIAEGDQTGGAINISNSLKKEFENYEIRVAVLGYIQRGGNPTARDRVLATRLGFEAVKALHEGHSKMMVGIVNNKVKLTALNDTFGKIKEINHDLVTLAKILR